MRFVQSSNVMSRGQIKGQTSGPGRAVRRTGSGLAQAQIPAERLLLPARRLASLPLCLLE
jgi:hypothetical protein